MIKLSKEQLSKLVLHQMSISTILLEACLMPPQEDEPSNEPEPEGNADDLEIDVVPDAPWETDWLEHDEKRDAVCGKWVSKNKKQPCLLIQQTTPGYMVVFGKADKKKDTFPELYLLNREKDYLYFNEMDRTVYLSHNPVSDTLTLSPGGEYIRETVAKK